MAYIYQIVNDINDKIYVGKTEFSIEKRFKEHCSDALKESCEKRPLYSAIRKYGKEHFHIELIEECDNPEEREIFWIKEKDSFKNGYNATMGGDGKKYIDYDLVVKTYLELQSTKDTAIKLGIHEDTVQYILKGKNISIKSSQEVVRAKYGKQVNMYDLQDNYIQSFESLSLAGQYLIDNHLSNCKLSTIRTHISEVCRNKRKTAAGFKWKFKEE